MKKYRVLGCKFNGSPAEWVGAYRDICGVGNYPERKIPHVCREFDIYQCLGMLALHHLGYKIPVDPGEFLNRGVDVFVDYFCGDWWKRDSENAVVIDKSRKDRDLVWFKAFSRGLLLGLLSERWKELAKVCNWVEADLPYEYMGEDLEEQLVDVYRSVAAGLRPEPMSGLDKIEARIRKCRQLRPKLLFQAWEAARNKDQSAFDAAFRKSLEHFRANAIGGPTPIHWIAPHHSVVGLAARRLGMKLPKLPRELDALVITPESLGLSRK